LKTLKGCGLRQQFHAWHHEDGAAQVNFNFGFNPQ